MPSEFLEHLQQKAREPEQPVMQPPTECPRCSALVIIDSMERHMDWHERTKT